MDLNKALQGYGTPIQIEKTVNRIMEKENWKDFIDHRYPYGTHINPYSIKNIVEDYYNKQSNINTHTTTDNEKKPKYIRSEYTNIFNPYLEASRCAYFDIYEDENGNELKREVLNPKTNPIEVLGGKRKSRRNKKIKNKKSRNRRIKKSIKNHRKYKRHI